MSYPAYVATKPSGVDWLGEVPKDWEVKRTRYVCRLNPTKSETNGLPPEIPVTFLPMEKVGTEGEINLDETRALGDVLQGFTYFRDGDIISAKITPCFENGKGAIVSHLINGIGFGSTEFHVLRPYLQNNPRFIYYLTKSHSFRSWGIASMYGAGGQKRVPEDFIEDFRIAFPPLPEQQQIATFLDRKTAELDAVLRLKERQLKLLAEKRQALISQAVTRGLDPNAPLKPSGIDWLGDVPEHWDIVPLKYITSFINGAAFKPTDWKEEGIPIIRIENLNGGDAFNFSDAELHPRYLVQKGDLLFGWSGNRGTSFGPFLWQREGVYYLNQHIFRLDNYTFSKSFFYWLLRAVTLYVESEAHGIIGLVHITKEDLGNISVPVPQPSEQKLTADFIDTETARMDGIAQAIRTQIDRVREYRQALISAAVTGKIDVRRVAVEVEAA